MSMTIEEAQKTIIFQAAQLRTLSEQHVAVIADFQSQHGQIVGSLNQQVTSLNERIAERDDQIRSVKEESARLLEQMAAAEAVIKQLQLEAEGVAPVQESSAN